MKILSSEKLSENKFKTSEGYLICKEAILARTGSQVYRLSELFDDGNNDEVEVYRDELDVFDEKAIVSFENKPITLFHPEEQVNSKNFKDLAVGFVRDVKRKNDLLIGNVIITNEKVVNDIENNLHIYLSCGYDCNIEKIDNRYYQKNIRGNHIALCDVPRAGITRLQDSIEPNIRDRIKSLYEVRNKYGRIETNKN